MIVALLSASLSLVVGLLAGAAIQRWSDAERATHGHRPEPDGSELDVYRDAPASQLRPAVLVVRDWGRLQ